MKIMKKILFILLTFFVLSGCEYEIIHPKPIDIPTDTPLSFADDILPIFDGCVSCHTSISPQFGSPDIYNILIADYINVEVPEESSLYLKLTTAGDSHEGKTTAEQNAYILEWIKQGAENN